MQYRGSEDRLNPLPPEGADEGTLGGYPAVHGRAPAFEGRDGQPYTAAIETERSEHGTGAPWAAYLVFLRWAQTGSAIMGHLETEDLARGDTEAEARARLEALPLPEVKRILDETITRKEREAAELPAARPFEDEPE